jgi:acetoin:2,6-dichlorophenolindophenol oxidoreductase subunit alpha
VKRRNSDHDLVEWLRSMIVIREFEEKVQSLFVEGHIQGTTHLCQGQEAVSVGSIAAIGPDDVFTSTYRGHGHALARGMAPATAFAELMGRSMGSSHGLGGSMHLADMAHGNLGSNAIVGAGLPIAVGAAFAFKHRREPRVALTFFGDGAANIGTFHEALNMASVWRVPIVFIIENNLYGEWTPLAESTAVTDLAVRGAAYAIPSAIVDGQDVEIVYAAVTEAVDRARAGHGPSLLEMKTYRYRGHSRTDPAKYRPQDELAKWRSRDPIVILRQRLLADGRLSPEVDETLDAEIQHEIDRSAGEALASDVVGMEELPGLVYSN